MKLRSLSMLCALVACSGACGSSSSPAVVTTPSTDANKVVSVVVSPPTATGGVSASVQYSAVPENASGNPVTGQTITWRSSDTTIVAVSSSGLAHTVGAGTATITATDGAINGTATATVVLYPNQPTGLTRFAELDFSGLPAAHGNPGVLAGDWWTQQTTTPAMITLATDSTAPQSRPAVLSYGYQAGTVSGYSGANGGRLFAGWAQGATESAGTEYKEVYESLWFKVPSATFETQLLGLKLFGYWGVGQMDPGGLPLQVYNGTQSGLSLNGPLNVNEMVAVSSWGPILMYIDVPGSPSRTLGQNIAPSYMISFQVWHQFEVHMKLNSTTSAADGVFEMWMDGQLLGRYTDIQYTNAAYPHGFWGRHLDAVWGSQGTVTKTRTDYVYFNHMYLSGVLK